MHKLNQFAVQFFIQFAKVLKVNVIWCKNGFFLRKMLKLLLGEILKAFDGVYNKLDFLEIDWKWKTTTMYKIVLTLKNWNRIAPEIIAMSIT